MLILVLFLDFMYEALLRMRPGSRKWVNALSRQQTKKRSDENMQRTRSERAFYKVHFSSIFEKSVFTGNYGV